MTSLSPPNTEDGDPLLLRSKLISPSKLEELSVKRWKLYNRSNELIGFYKTQNSHITRLLEPLDEFNEFNENIRHENMLKKKRRLMLFNLTFTSTIVISAMQLYSAIVSHSNSLGLICIDSVIDVLAGVAIKWTDSKIKNVDLNRYPCGGGRFRSVGNICYAFLMVAANFYVTLESLKSIINFNSNVKSEQLSNNIIIPILALTIKGILFGLYTPIKNESTELFILYEDQKNDVLLGVFGLVAYFLGSSVAWYVDPVGAIVISVVIIYNWVKIIKGEFLAFSSFNPNPATTSLKYNYKIPPFFIILCTLKENFSHLAGVSADNSFLQFITYKTLTFNNSIIMIDSCRAYHSGPRYVVEIDIVMDPETRLKESHDLAQILQDKLEDLDDVDRAFVHVDYETDHKPEHL